MKLSDIKDVLTFAAFRPEPDDPAAPWTRRFPRRRTLLLNVGKNRTSWRGLDRSGRLFDGGTHRGDFKEVAASLAADWRRLTDDGWCAVSLNSRYVISLEGNLPRREGIEDIMRANPRAALGSKYERNKRYALTNNPEHGTSIVLACDEEVIKKVEAAMAEAQLKVGRIACGPYLMLRRAIEHANHSDKAEPHAPEPHFLYVITCEGSICVLTQRGNAWSELRSRADFYDEDPSPVLELLTGSRRSGDGAPAEVLFASDQPGSPIVDRLREHWPESKVTDLTQPDHLWAQLADLRA